jgi:hypothetical protein
MSRMRRAYLKPYSVTRKPNNMGLSKEGMSELYDHMRHIEGHRIEIADDVMTILNVGKEWKKIKHLMEARCRMLEKNIHNLHIKEQFIHVVLQRSKYFSLVLFWNTGAGRYYFVKKQFDLISMSKPYVSRASAMDAHTHRDIFWLDFIRIPD